MPEQSPPPNPSDIMEHVDEALKEIELEPQEASEILSFANREVPHLQTPETSYFVLGSYRDPYIRRLRIVQNELDKRLGTYPFLMGDLEEIDVGRLPTFRIRFHLLAAYSDYIVAVYEQDAGGEVTELGKISSTPYFRKSHVLPRDYSWMTERHLETPEDVRAAAVNIRFSDNLDEEDVDDELDDLVSMANDEGVDVTRDELDTWLDEREDAGHDAVSYSWVHLNEFRLFELHGRCHPWATERDLRKAVERVP